MNYFNEIILGLWITEINVYKLDKWIKFENVEFKSKYELSYSTHTYLEYILEKYNRILIKAVLLWKTFNINNYIKRLHMDNS